MNKATNTILGTLNHVGRRVDTKPFVSAEWLMRMAEREDGCEISVGGLYTEMARLRTGEFDGMTEGERIVQEWRESGGGRARTVLAFRDGVLRGDFVPVESAMATLASHRREYPDIEEWLEYETPNAGTPTEAPSLPHTAALGHGGGKVSGEAETAAESGEIAVGIFSASGELACIGGDEEDAWGNYFKRVGAADWRISAAKAGGCRVNYVRIVPVEEQG